MRRIHIFRAGTHTPMQGGPLEFSAASLAATAAGYDPARHEAPIVVGHPPMDAPAYGWVERLQAEGGDLFAIPRQVEPAFGQMVREGRFKKVSASFFGPSHPRNPTPGQFYLKHVGFLGATPPAVPGLKPVEFGEDDAETVTIEFAAAPPDPERTPPVTTPNADEMAARERALAEREAAFAAREAEAQARTDAAFVESLVAGAQLPRGLAPRVVAFMAGLSAAEEISFAGTDGKPVKETRRDAFAAILKALPKVVDFAERGSGEGPGAGDPPPLAEFAGHRVDPDRLAVHRRALAYQRQHPNTDYLAAVLAVEAAG